MMLFVSVLSEVLLYTCFSLLLGSLILHLIHKDYRPVLNNRKGIDMAAAAGIAIFSFIPVLMLILHIYEDIGFALTLKSVLFTFEIGKAWILTYIIANVLFIYVVWFDYRDNRLYALIGLFVVFILIALLGWASHASSLYPVKGFFTHTVHFTAVCVWAGIILVVSFFSKEFNGWLSFLRWFTPVAAVCFLTTIVTGLFLMSFVMEMKDYDDSWMLPYGQALLIKHLFILVVLGFVIINSLFIKRNLKKIPSFKPIPWLRAESIMLILIFSATAALGQQAPPHDQTVTAEGVSKLFSALFQGNFQNGMDVQLMLNNFSLLFLSLAVLFYSLILFSFFRRVNMIFPILMGILGVISLYLAFMLSLK